MTTPSDLAAWPVPDLTSLFSATTPQLATLVGAIEKQSVLRFPTDVERDAAITTPEEGMLVVLTTPNFVTIYIGGGWRLLWGEGTYTPTLSGFAVGTTGAANTASWTYFGGTLQIEGRIAFGTSGATLPSTGTDTISPPPGFTIDSTATSSPLGHASYRDTGTASHPGLLLPGSGNFRLFYYNTSGASAVNSVITATAPHTWAVTDEILWNANCQATYTP